MVMPATVSVTPSDIETYRRKTDLYIGPWKDGGKPLDEAWR